LIESFTAATFAFRTMAYLVVHTPNHPPQRVALREAIIVGRSAGCEVWIEDSQVSRHHCRFEPAGDDWLLVDLESRNGTYVDGERIEQALIPDNAIVRIGSSEIEFHAERYISHRPADPFESARMEGSILDRESESEITTLHGQPVQPQDESSETLSGKPGASKPLPFTRPRPRPIVHEEADSE
jgi:pSer/pThr/pTyr-binding forkhead associated (FHA) protein